MIILFISDVNFYQKNLPELPDETRQKLIEKFGLSFEWVVKLVYEPDLLKLFLEAQNYGKFLFSTP